MSEILDDQVDNANLPPSGIRLVAVFVVGIELQEAEVS